MLEAVRVARAGFPVRYTHEQFTSRYAPLARRRHLRQEDDNETGSAAAAGGAAGDSGGGGGDGEAAAKEGDAAKLVSLEGAGTRSSSPRRTRASAWYIPVPRAHEHRVLLV